MKYEQFTGLRITAISEFLRAALKFKLFAFLPLLLLATQLFAQSTSGNLTGSIIDASGAAVPNATVIAKNVATSVAASTTSRSNGAYRLENLLAGTYSLEVTSAGFNKSVVNNIRVELNSTLTTNVTLTVASASILIDVTESSAAIDTTTAQVQTTFESRAMANLPSASGASGVLNLGLLTAGVGSSGAVGAGSGPSVGGQRPRNNNFTVEGIDNNSGSVTGPVVTVPNDAVSEFSALQNQFSPEFGHSSGGQFNLVVKSGSNQFHGTAYEYFQNRNLNAADNLYAVQGTPLHPRYDNNRFGGAVGGPIVRNKLFFFADYEYNPVGQAGSAGLLLAPTQAGYDAIAQTPGVSQTNLGIFKQYLGVAATPSSTVALGPNGTSIPIGQISIGTPNFLNNEYGLASIDYNPSEKDSIRGRFVLNRTGEIDTAASLPAFFQTEPVNAYLFTFSEFHNFSAALINEFRLGYNKYAQNIPSGNYAFPGLDQFPNIQINELNVQLGPDPNAPQYTFQNTYQLTDNVTWTKGAHTIKMGFDGQRNISPQAFTQRSRGDYEYTTLSNYLFDQVPDYLAQRSAGNPVYWGNRWMWGGYINDTWRMRHNLTVNLGLRYEYQTVPASEELQSLNAISSVPGLINFSSPKAQGTNLMPRIGLAYSPGSDGKTSIRAGFGINYDVLFDNLGLLSLPPQLSTTQDVTGNSGGGFLASGGLPANAPSAALSASDARAATAGYIPNVKRPKSYQWNFGIEHEFAHHYVFETRYLGTRGTDLDVQTQLNLQPVVNASNALPVYYSAPSQATLNSLPRTLTALNNSYNNNGNIVPGYLNAGFDGSIMTSYQPYGNSTYHGWANQLSRRYANGLQFLGAYTWSHAIDDSTADVFSTYSTPRRPQDSQNLRPDRSSSAIDHRNRFTLEVMYDLPFFKNSNWFLKNLVGNWGFSPVYTYQTGNYYTVQSGVDSNLNGDAAPDRAIVNPNGNPNIGSGTTALTNSNGDTVGYLVNNPNAGYISAPKGTISTAGRNTARLAPTNNLDVTAAKRFSIKEGMNLEFSARFFNILNHAQYIGGYLNDIAPNGAGNTTQLGVFTPTNPIFADPSQAFSSNPRSITLALKLVF